MIFLYILISFGSVQLTPNRGLAQVVQKCPISGFGLAPNDRMGTGVKNHVFDHETEKCAISMLQTTDT